MSIAVELRDVSRHFGDVRAVDSVSLAIEDGEFFSMLGPSGSGKTTCLRLIGGFELPTAGQILLHGEDASDLPPYERDVNTVFQDYALFPHLSVLDNVAYGLRMKGVGRGARRREAAVALEQVALGGLGSRQPGQLSGGQRQRVALARALVNRPRVLLLDEPLGALDLKLREQMQVELKGLQRRLGITFIYVTHDQGEALSMSDRVAVFNRGRVEQVDRPRELYIRPRTTFVAGFVGTANVLTGELARRITGSDRPVSIRPERVTFGAPGPGQLGIAGSVIDVQFHGPTSRFEIEAAGVRLSVTIANRDSEGGLPEPGDAVQLAWPPDAMVELRGSDADDDARTWPEPVASSGSSDATPEAPATPIEAVLPLDAPAAPIPAPRAPTGPAPIEPASAALAPIHAVPPDSGRTSIDARQRAPVEAPIEDSAGQPDSGPTSVQPVSADPTAIHGVSTDSGLTSIDALRGAPGPTPSGCAPDAPTPNGSTQPGSGPVVLAPVQAEAPAPSESGPVVRATSKTTIDEGQ